MQSIDMRVGKYLIDTKPYDEYNSLLKLAEQEQHYEVLDKHHVDYYITFVYNQQPIYFCQLVNQGLYQQSVYNIGGLYGLPSLRTKVPMTDVVAAWQDNLKIVFGNPINAKLVFAGKSPSKTKWHNVFIKLLGWSTSDDYYAVTEPRHLQRSWKNIYYSGDITALDVPRLNKQQYQLMFGKYYFRRSTCVELRQIAPTARVLIVGDPEAQAFTWLSDNKPFTAIDVIGNITKDSFNMSDRLYKVDVNTAKSNLARCNSKPIVVNQPNGLYNAIYIGASNIDISVYYQYLAPNGLLIEDGTRKD